MDKLLHERLRELGSESACCLADEIERYYIPRPRDNKGIPFVEDDIVYSIDPDTEYSAEVVKLSSNRLYICWEDGAYDWVDACDMQHEKPQPKILDVNSIVKCRDCRFVFKQSGHKFCFHNHNDSGESYLIDPNGFCSWGEPND